MGKDEEREDGKGVSSPPETMTGKLYTEINA